MSLRGRSLALGLAALLAAGCARTPRPPLPSIGIHSDTALVEWMRHRGAPETTIYAELLMGFDGPERSGTFDAVASIRTGGWMRLTAFKDLILATEPIFDIVLTPTDYAFEIVDRESDAAMVGRGPSRDFPALQPGFAAFFWAREALCTPGRVPGDAVTEIADAGPGRARVESRLSTGAAVSWLVDRDTGAVESAVVRAPGGGEYRLRYAEYLNVDGVLVPGRVVLEDPARETVVETRVNDLAVNVALGERSFDFESVGGR